MTVSLISDISSMEFLTFSNPAVLSFATNSIYESANVTASA